MFQLKALAKKLKIQRMTDIKTYGMSERADHLDFDIRSQLVRPPLVRPHRHEYFQIQINLQGDTEQNVAGTVRPFRRGYLSFILPYRVHVIPHPDGSRYVIINMAQQFLRPGLDVDPLDLEDVSLSRAPELAPFLFQEYADFYFSDEEFPEVEMLLEKMMFENSKRRFGSVEMIRGLMLQLIGMTCRKFEAELLRLSAGQAQQGSRLASLRTAASALPAWRMPRALRMRPISPVASGSVLVRRPEPIATA